MMLSRRQFTGIALTATAAVALSAKPSFAGDTRSGTFSGRKGYNVTGGVQVVKDGGTTTVVLGEDYVFDPNKNPPDIKIGFGNGETYAEGSKIHDKLTVKQGAATFEVPAGINTDDFSELYIYCEQYTVILGVAPLN
ncbi:MAG: DM13 domain-containing protein [Pseudomonadota bacterium]